jgi:hypothetical protein
MIDYRKGGSYSAQGKFGHLTVDIPVLQGGEDVSSLPAFSPAREKELTLSGLNPLRPRWKHSAPRQS